MRVAVDGKRTYRKSLGLLELVSLGVGGTIGSGIFVVPGIAAEIAGPWSLLAWLIVATSASCVALSLAGIQARSLSGASFTDIFLPVFGRWGSAGLVCLYLVSAVVGVATIAAGLGQYFSFFGIRHVVIVEIFVIAAFLGVNLFGIALSGRTENLLTAIVLIALALLPSVRMANLVPKQTASFADILKASIIVYWPFTGFEISAIPVEETKDPRRISRALLMVMAIVCVIYVVLNVALVGAVGSSNLAASPAPVAYATNLVFAGAAPVVAVVAIITMLSALNAYIVAASRVLQNLAVTYHFRVGAELSGRGTPAVALVASCVVSATLLCFSNHFGVLASVSVVTNLIPYIGICVAAFVAFADGSSVVVRGVALLGAIVTAAILGLYAIS